MKSRELKVIDLIAILLILAAATFAGWGIYELLGETNTDVGIMFILGSWFVLSILSLRGLNMLLAYRSGAITTSTQRKAKIDQKIDEE